MPQEEKALTLLEKFQKKFQNVVLSNGYTLFFGSPLPEDCDCNNKNMEEKKDVCPYCGECNQQSYKENGCPNGCYSGCSDPDWHNGESCDGSC